MEKNNIIIKKATVDDIKEIMYIQSLIKTNLISKKVLETDLQNPIYSYFIAYKNKLPVGFVGISNLLDTIDLQYIAVNTSYQNQGIGTKLFYHILHIAKENNINNIMLEVRASNENAICFYEKLGFTKISIRKNYYKDTNEDAFIYEKNLKGL